MITIKNVRTLDGQTQTINLSGEIEESIDAQGRLLYFPGMIDPHICFGPPDQSQWSAGIQSAIQGGITAAIDIPTASLPGNTKEALMNKQQQVKDQLARLELPLHLFFYASADPENIEQIGLSKKILKGIVLLSDFHAIKKEDEQWDRLFQMAAWEDLPIIINARNENLMGSAESLLEQAVYYAERQNTRLYILNVSNRTEIDFIQKGRERALLLYAETTPQHLFSQNLDDREELWYALNQGIIETIGSGYFVNDPGQEKIIFKDKEFSSSHPLFLLPQLFTVVQEELISMEKIARLLRYNIQDIFDFPDTKDAVLIDLEQEHDIQIIHSKGRTERRLRGWPVYTIIQGKVFHHSY